MTGYHMPDWLHSALSFLLRHQFYGTASFVASVTLKAGVWGRL